MIPLEWKLNMWLVFGVLLSVAWLLTVAILIRPKTRSGLAWWVLPVVAIGVVVPLLWKGGAWLVYVLQPALYQFDRVTDGLITYGWIFPVAIGLTGLGYGTWWLWQREKDYRTQMAAVELPAVQEPAHAQPAPMWLLPANTQQWDADSVQR